MLRSIIEENISSIKNVQLRDYERIYLDIQDEYYRQVESFGLPFDRENSARLQAATAALKADLKADDRIGFFNNGESICWGEKSPACRACFKGIGTATLFISFSCNRNCYFCFNPNQENYEYYSRHKNDWKAELDRIKASGEAMSHIALTGGEPLLYKDEAVDFFRYVRECFGDIHTRLYTTGDLLDTETLSRLRDAGLQELRVSIKLDDAPEEQEHVLETLALAKDYIPSVMVEMPVIPGMLNEMKTLLDRLDALDIFGINLLEFCYPLCRAEAYAARGFRIKYPPHEVLYDFWYAGGLPIAGSEYEALQLIAYAAERDLSLHVHYCSLANKHFGQIYRQNVTLPCGDAIAYRDATAYHDVTAYRDATMYFSERDFYLKTAKVFGEDAVKVKALFQEKGITAYEWNKDYQFIQFDPLLIDTLADLHPEIGISYNVQEERSGETVLRELKLDVTTPEDFSLSDL